jgi:hypothetical protein
LLVPLMKVGELEFIPLDEVKEIAK